MTTTTYGRGAWPGDGAGGTLQNADGLIVPGPYYLDATGSGLPLVGSGGRDANLAKRAVWYGVQAIQRRLKVQVDDTLTVDGLYGPATGAAVRTFQTRVGLTAWGGVGPDTAKRLLRTRIRTATDYPAVVCGFVQNESGWDPGAVGYTDREDLGLAQINGTAHPDLSEAERFNPSIAFEFVDGYLQRGLAYFDDDLIAAVVSYNLGLSGTQDWIDAGRPDLFGDKDVRGYYTRILSACGQAGVVGQL